MLDIEALEATWAGYLPARDDRAVLNALRVAWGALPWPPGAAEGTARRRLIEHYSPLVGRVSRRIDVPVDMQAEHSDRDDLIGYGVFGLIQAVERFKFEAGADSFDAGQQHRFVAFAAARIRGSILDEMRSMAWIPRSVKDRVRDVTHARAVFQHREGRAPTADELAVEADIDLEQLRRAEQFAVTLDVDSVDAAADAGIREVADLLSNPFASLDVDQLRWRLAGAIRNLNDQERTVLALCYREAKTFKEAADCLDASKTRICQIRTDALTKLRDALVASPT